MEVVHERGTAECGTVSAGSECGVARMLIGDEPKDWLRWYDALRG
jgi:hypothetical protein